MALSAHRDPESAEMKSECDNLARDAIGVLRGKVRVGSIPPLISVVPLQYP
jgi:hypothetical protein